MDELTYERMNYEAFAKSVLNDNSEKSARNIKVGGTTLVGLISSCTEEGLNKLSGKIMAPETECYDKFMIMMGNASQDITFAKYICLDIKESLSAIHPEYMHDYEEISRDSYERAVIVAASDEKNKSLLQQYRANPGRLPEKEELFMAEERKKNHDKLNEKQSIWQRIRDAWFNDKEDGGD